MKTSWVAPQPVQSVELLSYSHSRRGSISQSVSEEGEKDEDFSTEDSRQRGKCCERERFKVFGSAEAQRSPPLVNQGKIRRM